MRGDALRGSGSASGARRRWWRGERRHRLGHAGEFGNLVWGDRIKDASLITAHHGGGNRDGQREGSCFVQ
jgi:hypothetical protein